MPRLQQRLIALLRWSERYAKTDMVYVATGSFWFTVGRVCTTIAGFLLSVAYANLVDPTEYGIYKYILSVASILGIAVLPGLDNAYTQAVARSHEGDFLRVLKTKIRFGLIGGTGALALAAYYFFKGNFDFGAGFVVVALFIPLMDSVGMFDPFFQGRRAFKLNAYYAVLEQFVAAAAMFGVLFINPRPLWLLIAYFGSWTLVRAVILWRVYRVNAPNTEREANTIRYGIHLTAINLIPLIAQYLDRIIVFQFIGPVALAGYNFATLGPDQIKSYFKNVQGIALPQLSVAHHDAIKQKLPWGSILLGVVLLAAALAYIALAPLFFALVFPKYVAFVLYSQVYAISVLFVGAYLPMLALQAKESQKLLHFNLYRSFVQILSLFALTLWWGLWGIIAARILTDLYTLFLGLYYVKKLQ